MHITMVLPVPPSTNGAYANKGALGRVKTKGTTIYRADALAALQPYIIENRRHCDANLMERFKCGAKSNSGAGTKIAKRMSINRPSYGVRYTFYFPNEQARDIANFEKVLTDLLVEVGFMLDDQFIDDFHLKRGGIDRGNPRVIVEIFDLST